MVPVAMVAPLCRTRTSPVSDVPTPAPVRDMPLVGSAEAYRRSVPPVGRLVNPAVAMVANVAVVKAPALLPIVDRRALTPTVAVLSKT
ncbi:hypothetical protein D3C87_1778350 [compost metagenome]